MAESADRYRSAHNYRVKPVRFPQPPKVIATPKDHVEYSCHGCGKPGHIRPNCPDNPRNFKCKTNNEAKVNFVFESELKPKTCIIDNKGYVFNKPVEVMLDSGCSTVVVKDTLVPVKYRLGKLIKVYDYLGITKMFPQVRCFIKCKFFTGWVNARAAPIKFADVLVGLIPGVKLPCEDEGSRVSADITDEHHSSVHSEIKSDLSCPLDCEVCKSEFPCSEGKVTESTAMSMAVQTRASVKGDNGAKPLSCPSLTDLDVNKNDHIEAQKTSVLL